jgi:acetyl-CoA carboxylase biotin carboxyl carrier protein
MKKPIRKSKSKSKNVAAGVDLDDLARIVEFITLHGLEEFEYTRGDLHIRVRRPSISLQGNPRSLPAAEILVPPEALPHTAGTTPSFSKEPSNELDRTDDLHLVKSPIVGTFYASPSPGAEPFVKVGDHITMGQVLCIIEAMKLMNEIESDAEGEVLRIFGENGQPVEYGEPLFGIRPSRKK